ncbi:MAG: NADP-dependent oxidoreductase [Leptolyngbyaceae bacterium]|nr:NADP-dependent oxidoreductase [Leptolyngbyaceae bacterium]
MKAVRLHDYGDPEVLVYEEAPRPEPAAHEVLIRIRGAGVNPADWKIRQGYLKDKFPFPLPLIPGYDLAGIVEAKGSQVTDFAVGSEVFAMLPLNQLGAYAEYVIADAALVAPKPNTVDFTTAAGIPSIALTAWQALFDLAELQPGQTVLIHGAAGGVGQFAVQFARWKGAMLIIGTASTRNLTTIQQLGVNVAIDYTSERFEDVGTHVDVVLDTVGGKTRQRSWPVLKPGGILVSTEGAADPVVAPSTQIRGMPLFVTPRDNAQLRQIGELIDNGTIQPPTVETFALQDAAQVHRAIQHDQRRGKFVLQVG